MKDTLIMALSVATLALGSAAPAAVQMSGMPVPTLTEPGSDGRRIEERGLFANYFPPRAAGRSAAILLIGGSEGGLGVGSTRMAKALQADGFAVLQVAYFGYPGGPQALASVPLETFSRAIAWLADRKEVNPERIGVVGGSKGAEAALIVAARERAIKAVVVGMPSSVAWPGISFTAQMQPSWTAADQPVPYLPYAFGGDYRNIYGAYANGLAALGQHADAVIPVERIDGPVMLICGEADALWPSCPMADQVAARLKAKGFAHPVRVLAYPDAGHAVFGAPVDPANPAFPTLGSLGGSPEGNNAARKDGWPRALAFLHAALD
jgi:dienelactone hydrolase